MSNETSTLSGTSEMLLAEVTDEFLDRLNRGEQPEIEQYAERHPEIAAVIRQVFPALQVLRLPAADADVPADASKERDDLAGRLGDYRIIREIGRGGMGIVYEAEQVSLGRRVALKVLPFAAVLDSKQLQRFKNEAQAAAHLHHNNIVPVFSVGSERGVHYYAMQYIEGETLANLIHELRQLAAPGNETRVGTGSSAALDAFAPERSTRSPAFFRSVAELGVQAAEALQHAHELGVVHRDIKPSNLLLDQRGRLWVTDFGLARLESNPDLTLTGDVLGTLRYMSPEQAAGKHVLLDHRTDVYSLGVTLYELLTLKPAFDGRNRQELLRRIADEDPGPPRRLNAAIPADLETIVLRATAKEPERRYVSAKALTEDLQRFLLDKPIHAKRPTLLERASKWSRRHRGMVVSAASLLVMAVVGLSVGTVLLLHEQARTAAALEDSETQRQRADANYERARDAVEKMTRLAEEELADLPQMQPARRALFAEALKYYRGFLQERGDDPTVRYETGRAYRRVGDIRALLGQAKDAEAAYREAIGLLEKLAVDFPLVPEYAAELARSYTDLGPLLRGRGDEAAAGYHDAVARLEKLAIDHPDVPGYRAALAHALLRVGDTQAVQQSTSISRRLTQKFPDAPEYLHGLARGLEGTGNLREGPISDVASDFFERALVIYLELIEVHPDVRVYREGLTRSYLKRGQYQRQSGRHENAEQAYRRAVDLCTALASDFPAVPAYRAMLAHLHINLSGELQSINRQEEAEAEFAKGVAGYAELTNDFPNSQYAADYANALVSSARRSARALAEAAQWLEAEKEQPRAVTACYQVVPFAVPDTVAQEPPGFNIIRPAGTKIVAVRMIGSTVETFDEDATVPSSIKQVDGSTEPITVSVWRQPPPHLPPATALVGRWPAEGTAHDVCQAQPGTLHNGVAFESGKVGLGFRFDGVDDVVRIPHRNDLQPPEITVAAWIKVGQSLEPGAYLQLVVDKSHGFFDSTRTGWALQIERQGPVRWAYGNGLSFPEVLSTTPVSDGRFHHVVGTLDGRMLRVYVDGILEGSVSYIGTPVGNTRPVYIGAWNIGNLTAMDLRRCFNGVIDEVQVFSRALASEEIAHLFLAESAGNMRADANESERSDPTSGDQTDSPP